MKRSWIRAGLALSAIAVGLIAVSSGSAASALHHPIFMPAVGQAAKPALQPPPICCTPVGIPPAGQPAPVNMAYFGGHVQVTPKVYLVFWGWGQPGAFARAGSDPDGAAARMTAFTQAMGGTAWTQSQTQYYMLDSSGSQVHITNPTNQFGGTWSDDTNAIHNNVTGLELAQEAQRAVAHFGVTDLKNSQFVIATPQNYNEEGFNSGAGYCAWHDYTTAGAYPGVQEGISFTNMPYVLNMGTSCGENSVNSGSAGTLDGFTIVMGHEIEETVTDPGAESSVNGKALGAWYDFSGWENADKCAWVGYNGLVPASTVPGGLNNITGNDGRLYPVQSLWSNDSAAGTGWCAGAGDDLPTG
jgi:serine protease